MDNYFTVACDTCGDHSNSAPGLPCGRVDDDEDGDQPDATPCTGTYQRLPETAAPTPRPDPATWRALFAAMTPKMWWRLALLCVPVVVTAVIVAVGVVRSFTGR